MAFKLRKKDEKVKWHMCIYLKKYDRKISKCIENLEEKYKHCTCQIYTMKNWHSSQKKYKYILNEIIKYSLKLLKYSL